MPTFVCGWRRGRRGFYPARRRRLRRDEEFRLAGLQRWQDSAGDEGGSGAVTQRKILFEDGVELLGTNGLREVTVHA